MSWVAQELGMWSWGMHAGRRRLIRLVEDLSAQPLASLPVASGGWAETKAAYRLLDNDRAGLAEVLEVHTRRTGERMQGHPVCYASKIRPNWISPASRVCRVGRLSYAAQAGLYLHPTLVATPAGLALE